MAKAKVRSTANGRGSRRSAVKAQAAVCQRVRGRNRRFRTSCAVVQPVSLSLSSPVPSLRGSLESMQRQNATTMADGLARIEDDQELRDKIAHKELVALPASSAVVVSPELSEDRRYCRPWTSTFLNDLAKAYHAAFHKPLTISSAVRTVAYQKQLRLRNGNAAAAEGEIVSPHLTGASVDITKKDMGGKELAWMRQQLLTYIQQGKIDVAEEFKQSCFHITVYKSYLPAEAQPKVPVQAAKPAPVAPPSFLARWFSGM